ncbi:MAG: hypothetical protein FWF63_04105 [Fibromonadales bacterium]|nr:hypothetical protein [Fibromonadales bacterium]
MKSFFVIILSFVAFSFAQASLATSIISAEQRASVKAKDEALQTPVSLENAVDSNYIIGAGDFFEILFPDGPESIQVSPEGTLAIYGYGIVDLNGLKLHEAKRKILEKLKNSGSRKYVDVHLVQLRKFLVNVRGAVLNPGQVAVSGQARASVAIYIAGGIKPTANRDSLYIYRKGDTIATTEDILLQSGDIIEIPYREWQQAINLVYAGKATTVPYISNRTIREYAKDAGINIERGYGSVSIKFLETNYVKWIGINQIDSFSPEPSCDIEFHSQTPYVYVGGATATVGRAPYIQSMHAADYVAASGVSIVTGDFSRVSVMRNGKRISVDWANGEILPGDFIEIPRTVYEQVKDVTIFVTSLMSILATAFIIMGN